MRQGRPVEIGRRDVATVSALTVPSARRLRVRRVFWGTELFRVVLDGACVRASRPDRRSALRFWPSKGYGMNRRCSIAWGNRNAAG
jgi:hypothetical protein